MEGNEFEKQVRGKINELRVQPSAAVWDNVEALIKKDKRRRWGIIFFVLFIVLSGTGLILSGTWESTNTSSSASDSIVNNIVSINHQPEKNKSVADQTFIPVDSQKTVSKTSSASSSTHKAVVKTFSKKARTSVKMITPDINSDPTVPVVINNIEKVNTASIIPASSDTTNITAMIKSDKLSDSSKPSPAIKKKQADKSKKWILGITLSGGVSAASRNFGLSSAEFSSSSVTGGIAPPLMPGGDNRSSFGLNAGVTIRREVNSSISIGSGLNYQLFSTMINDQHIKYNYIQLPIEIQINLSNGKLPFYWHTAASLSVFLGSSANPDSTTRSYNSFFNKTQVGLGTGLFIKPSKKHSLFIGPYLYYGVSKIATTGFYKDQHFTFIGLQTKFEFRKK